MASAIPSSTAQRIKYDVFLSFRGTDTRNSFVSHLYAALCRERISTFLDIGLKRQEEITATMHKSIEASRTSIVIFSKNYGASPWCLDELVKILECRKTMGQIVLPVFYEVDPREVRKQSGAFGEAFSRHVIDFTDKVSRWRTALAEAANYSGWVLGDTRPESLVINDIVNYILKRLHQLSSNLDGLIGMDSHVKQLETLLCLGSFDNRTVGIWGMGGIGKTTIARVIFNKMSGSFENRCFLGNIREKIGKTGLLNLQREFLCEISGGENISADTVDVMSSFIIKRLRNKKVLVVLDDVDNLMDLSSLTGGLNLFGPGSRIIVTSRDKQVLQYCGVDSIYEVKGLNNHESLQLFSHYAFEQSLPTEAYWNLSNRVLQYAKGLPLALKICGSHLCTRSIEQWESILHRLESPLNSEVQEVLQISYYGLDDLDKDIFLDIACFFRGQGIDHVKEILYDSGFYADIGIARLIGKSLISISDKRLEMHNLVQEMGWEIVRQESIYEPGSRSRLWNHEEIYHVLTSNKGTGAVRGINLDLSKIHKLCLSSDSFTRMGNLKFLKFYTPFSKYWEDDSKLYALEGLAYLPASLRLLHWDRYPLNSLPSNFEPRQLVELILCHSKLELLWEGAKLLESSFSRLSSLEHLDLRGNNFSNIPGDIRQLFHLKLLDISSCSNLRSLPELPSHIEYVNAHDCTSLESVSIPSSFTVSEWNRPMFLFTNCFKLNLSAFLNSQFIDLQESGLLPSAGICFPGSKIPEQISHQSAGSLLTVQLPVHWSNSQFRGFALAAVIGFKDCLDNHGFLVKCTIKLRAMHGDSISLQQEFIIFHGHSGHWNNSRILGSDHVFLSYNHRVNLMESQGDDWQNKSCHTTASFDFYAVDSMGRPLCGSEVRECGFSLQLAEEENVCGPSCYYY
ncbi:ATP binding protein, putative [Ricinus communis]|uniref:ADP-ribosyl cyclase/cyclic ADP-ribose hydrolase n=1 Tax=Ricinus communis TaxID=3988 RepID=B9SNY0_RICCO|nr:ATP binding protein, putative [Ricinus communis]